MAMTPRNPRCNRFDTRTLFAALVVAVTVPACGEEFDPPSLIEKTRVLGATVEVVGDPTRATPRPGESATVTWIMAAPEALPPLAWLFVVCRYGASPAEACAPAPRAVAQGTGTPTFEVAVPTADVLGTTPRLQLFGQICQDSAPTIDPATNLPACAGGGTMATLDIYLQLGEQANHSPALVDRPFWFDGADWPADGAALDCASMPRVAAGSTGHVLRLATLAEDRETIVTPSADPTVVSTTTREVLQISNFTTAGKLGQSYSFVEASDPRSEADVDVTWDAPSVSPIEGRVHFTFVARDLRGGVGVATRTVCLE
jgi:hypothetical protein